MSYLIKTPQELLHFRLHGNPVLCKGGGGGQREATEEERRLWSAQASSLEGLNEIAQPTLRTGMNNLSTLTNQSMDGTLGQTLRNQAGANAAVAQSTAQNDLLRSLGSVGGGIDPTTSRGADIMANASLEGAKQRIGAMNQAGFAAEDQKWQRNAALTGLASGQGAQAVQGMGQLSGQLSANRNAANANDAQALAGLGQGAMYLGSKLFNRGGLVRKEACMADGGLTPFRPAAPSKLKPWTFSGGAGDDGADPAKAIVGGLGLAYNMSKSAQFAKPYIQKGVNALADAAGSVAGRVGAEQAAAPVTDAIPKAVESAAAADATAKTADAANVSSGSAGTPYISAGLDLAQGNYGRAAVSAVADTVLPGSGPVASLLLPEFADGGNVQRNDFTPGGAVRGPGTETSDSIPARLSNGEFVLNAEAVKMIGVDKLTKINNAGLRRRGGIQPSSWRRGEVKMAGGGWLNALGHIAGGAVPVAMHLDQVAAAKRQRDEDRAYRASRDAVADARYAQHDAERMEALNEQKTAKAVERALPVDSIQARNDATGAIRQVPVADSEASMLNPMDKERAVKDLSEIDIDPEAKRAAITAVTGVPEMTKQEQDAALATTRQQFSRPALVNRMHSAAGMGRAKEYSAQLKNAALDYANGFLGRGDLEGWSREVSNEDVYNDGLNHEAKWMPNGGIQLSSYTKDGKLVGAPREFRDTADLMHFQQTAIDSSKIKEYRYLQQRIDAAKAASATAAQQEAGRERRHQENRNDKFLIAGNRGTGSSSRAGSGTGNSGQSGEDSLANFGKVVKFFSDTIPKDGGLALNLGPKPPEGAAAAIPQEIAATQAAGFYDSIKRANFDGQKDTIPPAVMADIAMKAVKVANGDVSFQKKEGDKVIEQYKMEPGIDSNGLPGIFITTEYGTKVRVEPDQGMFSSLSDQQKVVMGDINLARRLVESQDSVGITRLIESDPTLKSKLIQQLAIGNDSVVDQIGQLKQIENLSGKMRALYRSGVLRDVRLSQRFGTSGADFKPKAAAADGPSLAYGAGRALTAVGKNTVGAVKAIGGIPKAMERGMASAVDATKRAGTDFATGMRAGAN